VQVDIIDRDKASELFGEAARFQYVFAVQQTLTPRPPLFYLSATGKARRYEPKAMESS
jgi:hypothetical protein